LIKRNYDFTATGVKYACKMLMKLTSEIEQKDDHLKSHFVLRPLTCDKTGKTNMFFVVDGKEDKPKMLIFKSLWTPRTLRFVFIKGESSEETWNLLFLLSWPKYSTNY